MRATLTEAGATLTWVWDPDPEKVEAFIRAFPQAKAADSLEAIEDSWRTANERKREYRKSIGYATDEELRALLGKHYEKLADPIRDRLKLFADAEG